MKFSIDKAKANRSGIYIIANNVNSKVYVGSAVNLANRFRTHLSDLQNNKHHSKTLQNFVNKYGIGSLAFSLLKECEKEKLLQNEQLFLDAYESYNNDLGFNHCKIAGSRIGVKASIETIAKITGKKQSLSARSKMSKAKKGKTKVTTAAGRKSFSEKMKGRKFTEDHKAKIKASKTGELNSTAKITDAEVLQIRKMFHSQNYKSIAAAFNISTGNVRNIIKGLTWLHLPLEDYSKRAKRIH